MNKTNIYILLNLIISNFYFSYAFSFDLNQQLLLKHTISYYNKLNAKIIKIANNPKNISIDELNSLLSSYKKLEQFLSKVNNNKIEKSEYLKFFEELNLLIFEFEKSIYQKKNSKNKRNKTNHSTKDKETTETYKQNFLLDSPELFLNISDAYGRSNERVYVEIKLDNYLQHLEYLFNSGIAFTLEYGNDLLLDGIESNFFDTFDYTQNEVIYEFNDKGLYSIATNNAGMAVNNVSSEGFVRIAAARCNEDINTNVLFKLYFKLKDNSIEGFYPIRIKPTVLNNKSAGYDEAKALDILVGSDTSKLPTDENAYPVLVNSDVDINGYSSYSSIGLIFFLDINE